MATKAEALATLDAGYDEFHGKIEKLDDAAFSEVWLGDWSVEQLLAHMSGWYREITHAFERVERGERPLPEGVDYSDSDAWNAKFTRDAKKGRAALADYDEAFRAYRAAAARLDEDRFGEDNGRPKIGNRLLQASGIGHFEEHQEQLDQWLASRN